MAKTATIKKARWHRLEAFFDEPARKLVKLENSDVILQGVLREDGTEILAVCSIPPETISNEQGEALRNKLTANLHLPVALMTNNIHLMKLREISDSTAKKIMMGTSSEPETKGVPVVDAEEKGSQ